MLLSIPSHVSVCNVAGDGWDDLIIKVAFIFLSYIGTVLNILSLNTPEELAKIWLAGVTSNSYV